MRISQTGLEGCIILEPTIFEDQRGYFLETYNKSQFDAAVGHPVHFVQDNQSFSKYGVIRALHFQRGTFAQAKLVRVLQGRVLDVVVDLRRNSPTFGEHISIELSADNKRQLFIPRGFAHGFVTLSESAEFFYKCDNFYNKEAEGGIIFNDPTLNIDWVVPKSDQKLSPKDLELQTFKSIEL